jgi:CHAD domain-containing protein
MSFAIEPGDSPAQAVLRAAGRDIDQCLQALSLIGADTEKNVHGVRKRIKRLRSLLRLVRFSLAGADYRRANAALRDASRLLATAREAAVRRRGLDLMLRTVPRQDEEFAATLRQAIVGHVASDAPSDANVTRAREHLASARIVFESLGSAGEKWSVVQPGLRRSHALGRRFMRQSWQDTSTHAFHEWRKWVKYQWHQMELLTPVWPEELELRCAVLKRLSDVLGDEHDLADLREHLLAAAIPLQFAAELQELLTALDARRAELRREALRIGTRLFAEKPAAFERRLGRYYRAFAREELQDVSHSDDQ